MRRREMLLWAYRGWIRRTLAQMRDRDIKGLSNDEKQAMIEKLEEGLLRFIAKKIDAGQMDDDDQSER